MWFVADVIDVYDDSASWCVYVSDLYTFIYIYVSMFLQLSDYISDVASNMMLVEEHILWMAQNEARACTRIVQCVEQIADLVLAGDNQAISKVMLDFIIVAPLLTVTLSKAVADYLTKCTRASPFLFVLAA